MGNTVMRLHKWMQASIVLVSIVSLVNIFAIGGASALDQPNGQVVLTVTGTLSETNQNAPDELDEGFFDFHKRDVGRAGAFDIGMLEALGTISVMVSYHKWPAKVRLEGPRLDDVLNAVGAPKGTITAIGLDGYTVVISPEELAAQNWILAIKRDGKYLGIGGRGPTWLVYDPPDGKPITNADDSRWPWAVFLIDVK